MVDDRRPIVVGGCYRSGTSLVRRLLDAHPGIHCGPEVKFFRDFYGDYVEDPIRHVRFMASARTMVDEATLFELMGAAFVQMHERAAAAAGKRRWADKAPENLVFLEQWRRLLGDEWVLVHVCRNPLDTLASIEEAGFPVSIPAGLEERLDLYCEYNRAGLEFGERHPARYVRVLYEALVAEPEKTVRELMRSLGEELDPGQLDFNAVPHQRGLEDPKVAETTEIGGGSVNRWRDVLADEEAERVLARTDALWRKLDAECCYPLP